MSILLKKRITKYVEDKIGKERDSESIQIELFAAEKHYIERHSLLFENVMIAARDEHSRFEEDVYIERCDKESEELLAKETSEFFNEPIQYFQKHLEEFIYVESPWFDMIGVDAVSFEADSVFRTYDVMLGLKLQKKYGDSIQSFLLAGLNGEETAFDLMFDANEGIWNLNFTLNELEYFDEEWTIRDAYQAIYHFLFSLAENIEEK
jgi:hypothetical protein